MVWLPLNTTMMQFTQTHSPLPSSLEHTHTGLNLSKFISLSYTMNESTIHAIIRFHFIKFLSSISIVFFRFVWIKH